MYFLRRAFFLIPALLVISFLAFLLVHLAPGGPFDKERRPAAPEIEAHLKAKYHLDEPFWKQYARYLRGLLKADFGPSLKYRNHNVSDIIAQGLPVTLTLGFLAFALALGAGIPLGLITALRRHRRGEGLATFLALLAICVPAFLAGPILIMIFAIRLRWFPVGLWASPWHVVLPTVTLAFYFAGRTARLMAEGMRSVLPLEFVTTARAKGLSEGMILVKHAFPLAVLPVVSYSGPLLAELLTGSFVVENLFQIPGIGVFLVNSSLNRDYPMVVGLVLLYAALLLALNLLVDFSYSILDPRVRYE